MLGDILLAIDSGDLSVLALLALSAAFNTVDHDILLRRLKTSFAPTTSVCDLGIYIDSDLSMRTQVTRTVAGCFAVLRQLRSIRRSVPDPVF